MHLYNFLKEFSMNIKLTSALALSIIASPLIANAGSSPISHAPIGVMGDHIHNQGEWMLSYKYEISTTQGLRNGAHHISPAQASAYGEIPTGMEMRMYMFEAMYGVTNDLTLMLMPQYMEMDMTHLSFHGGGHRHTHEISGLGDTELTGLYRLFDINEGGTKHNMHLNFGVSLPTGSDDEKFADHHNNTYNLPSNMQLGTGTYDPIIGTTYTGATNDWAWGAQTLNYIRTGKNNQGYRQGNEYNLSLWAGYDVTDYTGVTFRLDGKAWRDVHGRDVSLPINTIVGANPNELAGERVMANIGVNFVGGPEVGEFEGHRFAIEFGLPIHERFSGIQPETGYRLTAGWQKSF